MEFLTDEQYDRSAKLYAQALLQEGKTLEELLQERGQKIEAKASSPAPRSYMVEGYDIAIAQRTQQ